MSESQLICRHNCTFVAALFAVPNCISHRWEDSNQFYDYDYALGPSLA